MSTLGYAIAIQPDGWSVGAAVNHWETREQAERATRDLPLLVSSNGRDVLLKHRLGGVRFWTARVDERRITSNVIAIAFVSVEEVTP